MSAQIKRVSFGPQHNGGVYDYVIVGAGSAGCVLAARLGEDGDVRVGVIEAGPPDSEAVIHTPLAFRQLWDSRFDWGLWSESEPGFGDRRDYLPRGRVLGGSSSLNTMIYMRGHPADCDGWAAMGLAGWGYQDHNGTDQDGAGWFQFTQRNGRRCSTATRGASQLHAPRQPEAVPQQHECRLNRADLYAGGPRPKGSG
jgi:hypothetical protein